MAEQRRAYKGDPPRAWFTMSLIARDGATRELCILADTGNPCALIVPTVVMRQFNTGGGGPNVRTNFGVLRGGWLRVAIRELSFDRPVLAYTNEAVIRATRASSDEFDGLAGLPLLRLLEYGGDDDSFWIRGIAAEQHA